MLVEMTDVRDTTLGYSSIIISTQSRHVVAQTGFLVSIPKLCVYPQAMGLRLLHQSELRNLQTRINEIIVKAQSVTADPKTDERLGRVGK